MSALFGSIEAGGTKFRCAVGTGPDDIRAETRIDTTEPIETLGRAVAFFEQAQKTHGPLAAIGIGCFGPVDLDRTSPTYGRITTTPKEAWVNTPVHEPFANAFDVPVGFDTDVNAAALAERRWGAGAGAPVLLYLTVGTGIGGGVCIGEAPYHGLRHPEMGHQRVPRVHGDSFAGHCSYHHDCWEGLASGAALQARWGQPAERLPPDHQAWELEAEYLARGLANLVFVWSPTRIVLGGGVMQAEGLLPRVRHRLADLLGDYTTAPTTEEELRSHVVLPALGQRAGLLGGFLLAQRAEAAAD